MIDALLDRIDALSDEEASEFVATSVANHHGLACPLDWRQVDAAWLQRLAFHLGGHRLAVICRRLASNLELFGSGLPDLTLLREETREDAMSPRAVRGGEGRERRAEQSAERLDPVLPGEHGQLRAVPGGWRRRL